jgi:hypothetical protein
MSSDDTVTRVSGEGPGPSPGGIAGHTNAEQIALDFGIPTSTLSTWIKNSDGMLYYGVL